MGNWAGRGGQSGGGLSREVRAGMPADRTTVAADRTTEPTDQELGGCGQGCPRTKMGWRRTERRWGLGSECVIYSRCLSQMASTLEVAEYARRG